MWKKLAELYQYREVLINFASQELKVKYKRSFLGFLWSLLNPVLTMIVTSIVFAAIMRFQLNNFVIFIYSGLLPWGFISISMEGSTNSLINAEGYIKKVYLPKMIFPIAGVLSNFINMLFSMVSLFFVLIFIGAKLNIAMLFLPISFLLVFLATTGISLILATITVFFRDIKHIIGVITGALFYLTPILYPIKQMPAYISKIASCNPFYYLIDLFRSPIYEGKMPSLEGITISVLLTLFFLFFGLKLFIKYESDFVYRL
jgi:ABC-type polysaccharide/polyol phosphate export permease